MPLLLLGLVLLVLAMPKKLNVTRGVRNNNPGNLRKMGSWQSWDGLAPDQTDPEFVRFVSSEKGIELLAQVLLNKQIRKGLTTPRAIVLDYAPPKDGNDPAKYLATVLPRINKSADQPIDLAGDRALHLAFTNAVIYAENSYSYPASVVQPAVMAGRRDLLGARA
jgi:hypothetical protein